MRIPKEVLIILAAASCEGNKMYLPNRQLDRKLYVAVDKVLKALGGKWNRGQKAHLFNKDVFDIIEEAVLTGDYVDQKKHYQFFETPVGIVEQLVALAEIQEGETVLEPSAGRGSIAKYLKGCDCVELNPDNYEHLKSAGFNLVGRDFLSIKQKYDVVVANPPFTKQQDITHINRMLDIANRKVVSIASASVMFRDNNKTVDFRDRVASMGGTITPLPENSFKSSGTSVQTCVVEVSIGVQK